MPRKILRPRCERTSCLFNYHGICDPYKKEYLILNKKGKCTCYEKNPRMKVNELIEELENDNNTEKIFTDSAVTIYTNLGLKMNKKDIIHAKKLAKKMGGK